MKHEERLQTGWITWTLVLLAVPLLYLLSVPPVTLMTAVRFNGVLVPSGMGMVYRMPDQWLRENTPLWGLLARYFNLWWDLAD